MEHINESNIRKFIASSEIFGGYEVYIDLNYCNSLDDIVNVYHENLLGFLNQYNLKELVTKLKQCKFHIHNFTFETICISDEDNVFHFHLDDDLGNT